ncbi:MAG TPA: patatin-like phospholipase family protein [Candidatus Bathyarchaeia archaeon]|nr:patatin-like phospholipase family protein [Candidatus Bathyarchaeia archaeon]
MDTRIGIVLGGGGTLGDFQVGALKYLYDKDILLHISCVCGTSIGAINAVIVSTGLGCDKLLEQYWSENVIGRDDLIPQHNWSEHIAPMLNAFLLAEKGPELPMERRIRSIGRMRAIAAIIQESRESPLRDIKSAVDDLEDIFGTAIAESALYKMDKLKQRMEEKIDNIEAALDPNIVFCLYATNVETGKRTCFTNNTELEGARGDTFYVQCHSPSLLIEAALGSAAVPLIFPPVEVIFPHDELCGKYFIDGGARQMVPVKGAIACKADTVYAILCLPRFEKRKYAFLDLKDAKGEIVSGDWCTSNLLDVEPEDWVTNNRDWNPTSDECDMINIANRTGAIVMDELTKGALIATDEAGNIAKDEEGKPIEPTVIDPLIPVHGWTQLNIGLLKINADQGYMRAFDVLSAGPIEQQCEELTAEITFRRIKIWALEHKLIEDVSEIRNKSQALNPLWGGSCMSRVLCHCCEDVVNTNVLKEIRQMKTELKECIDRRRNIVKQSSLAEKDKKRCLPDDYVCMYMCWEPHDWRVEGQRATPLIPTPWHKLDLGELGSAVIEEDWSIGRLLVKCKRRSLLNFGEKSHRVTVV